jgi:hypothetical protein
MEDKSPCDGCKDCDCAESETPNLDLLEQLQGFVLRAPEEEGSLSIDRDNADLYAFSNVQLKTLRTGKEADQISPIEWSHSDVQNIARQIVGKRLDV